MFNIPEERPLFIRGHSSGALGAEIHEPRLRRVGLVLIGVWTIRTRGSSSPTPGCNRGITLADALVFFLNHLNGYVYCIYSDRPLCNDILCIIYLLNWENDGMYHSQQNKWYLVSDCQENCIFLPPFVMEFHRNKNLTYVIMGKLSRITTPKSRIASK